MRTNKILSFLCCLILRANQKTFWWTYVTVFILCGEILRLSRVRSPCKKLVAFRSGTDRYFVAKSGKLSTHPVVQLLWLQFFKKKTKTTLWRKTLMTNSHKSCLYAIASLRFLVCVYVCVCAYVYVSVNLTSRSDAVAWILGFCHLPCLFSTCGWEGIGIK